MTFNERMVQAGAEIVTLHTGMPLELCGHIIDKSIRRASPEFDVTPYATESLSPEEKLAIARRSIELVGEDLLGRGISPAMTDVICHDLETFYRGVRGFLPSSEK